MPLTRAGDAQALRRTAAAEELLGDPLVAEAAPDAYQRIVALENMLAMREGEVTELRVRPVAA